MWIFTLQITQLDGLPETRRSRFLPEGPNKYKETMKGKGEIVLKNCAFFIS